MGSPKVDRIAALALTGFLLLAGSTPVLAAQPTPTATSSPTGGVGDPIETTNPSASASASASATAAPSATPDPTLAYDATLAVTFAPDGTDGHRRGGSVTLVAVRDGGIVQSLARTTDAEGHAAFDRVARALDGTVPVTWIVKAQLTVDSVKEGCITSTTWQGTLERVAQPGRTSVSVPVTSASSSLRCDRPTSAPTMPPTQAPTQTSTDMATAVPTEVGTDQPTQAPTGTPPLAGAVNRSPGPPAAVTPPATDASTLLRGSTAADTWPILLTGGVALLFLIAASRPTRRSQRQPPR